MSSCMLFVTFIAQAVDTTHPRANEYLYSDCQHISDFFTKVRIICVWTFVHDIKSHSARWR